MDKFRCQMCSREIHDGSHHTLGTTYTKENGRPFFFDLRVFTRNGEGSSSVPAVLCIDCLYQLTRGWGKVVKGEKSNEN